MAKRILDPNTTFYPAAVVLSTSGGDKPNVMTCNRITSVSAEPPRLAISIRPGRYTHMLIKDSGEFLVNIPARDQETLTDYLGVVTGRKEDKIAIAGLKLESGLKVKSPLLADCPVNIECVVESAIDLDSHTQFIGLVQAVHVEETLLDNKEDINLTREHGVIYRTGAVRERPTYAFSVNSLSEKVRRIRRGP